MTTTITTTPCTIIMLDTRRTLSQRLAARRHCGPYQWTPTAPGAGRGFYSSTRDALTMDEAGSTLRLRLEWANAMHPQGRRPTAYGCDVHGDGDSLTPVVARLPSGRGFLAGWTMGAGMCGSLDSTIYPDAEDAARAAHDLAEADAERSRDAQADELEDAA